MTQEKPADANAQHPLEDLVPNADPKGGETKTKGTTTTQQEYLKVELKEILVSSYQS